MQVKIINKKDYPISVDIVGLNDPKDKIVLQARGSVIKDIHPKRYKQLLSNEQIIIKKI